MNNVQDTELKSIFLHCEFQGESQGESQGKKQTFECQQYLLLQALLDKQDGDNHRIVQLELNVWFFLSLLLRIPLRRSASYTCGNKSGSSLKSI